MFELFYLLINARISHVIITLIHYFIIPKSRDLVSHNPGISGLKNGPGSRDPGIRDPGIAIPTRAMSIAMLITTGIVIERKTVPYNRWSERTHIVTTRTISDPCKAWETTIAQSGLRCLFSHMGRWIVDLSLENRPWYNDQLAGGWSVQ